MTWQRIATAALGIGAAVAGTLVPPLAFLVPIGTGIVGLAIPSGFLGSKSAAKGDGAP